MNVREVEAGRGGPSVLAIDDERNVLASLRRALQPAGYEVFTADSGPAALAMLEGTPTDVVICDMRMPQMSGADAAARAR